MNKPQYLAELNQLLIFMTRADREQTLARYGALFDKAGSAGQEALLSRLGSPTHSAIRLSRIYDADGYTDELLESLEALPDLSPELAPEEDGEVYEDETPDGGSHIPVEDDLPDYDLPDLPEPPAGARFVSLPVEEPAAPTPAEPADEPSPASDAKDASGEDDADYEQLWGKRPEAPVPAADPVSDSDTEDGGDELPYEDEEQPPAPVFHTVRVMPLWVGVPLFILALAILVLPLTLIGILLIPALALPGLAGLLAAFLAFVGGLWCLSIIADAAVLFGLAFILLAIGLVVLWCGLWLDVTLLNGYISALSGLTHLTLGRKVAAYA